MATDTSSIDDVLLSQTKTTMIPTSPEETRIETREAIENAYEEIQNESAPPQQAIEEAPEPEQQPQQQEELDDYGNEKKPGKVYTEAELYDRINQTVRERLERIERNQSAFPQNPQVPQVPQPQQPASDGNDWQAELNTHIRNTVMNMTQEQAQAAYARQEMAIQAEFEAKMQRGMQRFDDFYEVVRSQPITDAMVTATRSMEDPAAFLRAACKQTPQEIQRIASLKDPVAQAVEMGKLEERLRKTKATVTKAPRPIGRQTEDTQLPTPTKQKELTIEQLIANEEARRIAKYNRYKK